jgi:hypothetical protein
MLIEGFTLGIPVIVLAAKTPTAGFIVKSMFLLRIVLSLSFLFFGPKVAILNQWWSESQLDTASKDHESEQTSNKNKVAASSNNEVREDGSMSNGNLVVASMIAPKLQLILDDPKLKAKILKNFKDSWAEGILKFLDLVNLNITGPPESRSDVYLTIVRTFFQEKSPLYLAKASPADMKLFMACVVPKKKNVAVSIDFDVADPILSRIYKQVYSDFASTVQFEEYLAKQMDV